MKQVRLFISRIAIALIILLSISARYAIPVNASGDAGEKIIVYAQVPDDWEKPCVWAWNDDGNNAFANWPCGEMESDGNNPGWNYIYIPKWANHVIINANRGEVQADEIALEGKNTWVTVKASNDVDLKTEQITKGDIPEYVKKFAVHAKVDASWGTPSLWAWSAPDGTNAFEKWPGNEMTEGTDG